MAVSPLAIKAYSAASELLNNPKNLVLWHHVHNCHLFVPLRI